MARDKAKVEEKKERKTIGGGRKPGKGIVARYNRFLHSGVIFSFVTWCVQVAIEFLLVYGGTLMASVYVVPLIINAFIPAAAAAGRAEMFWIPTSFTCLVLALVMVKLYAMAWHALNRRFGKLRDKRRDQLRAKYGAGE